MKFIKSLIFFLLFGRTLFSQNSFLWKVEKSGHKTSYFFMLPMFVPSKYFHITKELKCIIKNVDVNVFPYKPVMSKSEIYEYFLSTLLTTGTTIKNYFPEDYYKQYISFLRDSVNCSEKYLQTILIMKPRFVYSYCEINLSKNLKCYFDKIFILTKKYRKKYVVLDRNDLEKLYDTLSVYLQAKVFIYDPERNYNFHKQKMIRSKFFKEDNFDSMKYYLIKLTDTIFSPLETRILANNVYKTLDSISKNQSLLFLDDVFYFLSKEGIISKFSEKRI